ncbi:cilia- and flagella-associated protein 61 [Cololabis saira]|uniref:cilia- and flagella-associated protein 61 n=1 Tax=Cololabis saira TaxID=129043 RepID=UPI002AD42E63|nr:cilia- and flagella-associated protein 61 [Cololabis saira]
MRRITSSSGQHETVTLRRSESSDAPGICSLVNPSDRDVFGKINVMQLLEKAELAVTVADDQDQVLAHACFLDHPAAALVDPARWEHLVWEQLGAHACTPVNTLFMHLFVAREGFGPAAAEEIMRASFRAVSHLDYILLLTREAGDLGPALERVMEPLQPQTELRCRGWICCREELEPKLRVRQARVEDFDSILSRFEEKQRSSYVARPYLLSELIEGQNDDLHMAVCEVDGSVVGFMSVTSELELQQLAAVYNLEGQDQETSSPVSTPTCKYPTCKYPPTVDESVVGFMSVSSELDLQQLAAINDLEGQDQETSSPDCKCPGTGEGVSGKPTAATWPLFEVMDEVLGQRPSVAPPVLMASIHEDTPGPSAAVGDQEEEDEEDSRPGPAAAAAAAGRKRDRDEELLNLIKEDMRLQREAEERRAQENRERMDRLFSLLERFGRHLSRQLVPPRSTADCLQPILPLILSLILHRLVLQGHDVTGPKADVRYKGVVHLQRLEEDGPEPGLHHSIGTLYNGACPGMTAVEALGSHTFYRSFVGRDEGEWMLEARPEEEHQGLNCDTPSVSPLLVEQVQQHGQGLSAQPQIWPCVLLAKKPVQHRNCQVYPAVQGSGLDRPTAASPEQAGVFRIQLFGIDKEHETRSVDLISYMFQRFPELKFLFISVSPSSPEFPLLQNLVRVPTGPATPALCELYFLPSAWKGKILVRPAVPADLPAVSGLVKDLVSGGSLDSGESLLQDLDSFYKTGSDADAVRLGAFVAQVDGQIFGILIIRDEQDPEFLRSLYDLEWFLYWTHHGSEEHGLILHLVLVPWFQFLVRLLLKEALRLGGKSCLYLRGYQDEQHPQNSLVSPLDCVLSVSVPVRPRRQIIYPLEELGANAPPSRITEPQEPFSLSLVSRKLILEQKVTINSRIVVVGASDTGLSFLEELCSCPHIRFNNLTLISTHGFPGDQKPDHAGFLSTSHAYSSRDLNRFPAGSQFRVLTGKMVSINRKSRAVLVSSGEEVPYHQLVLSTGLQYQVPGVLQPLPNDGPAPSNLLTLNDFQDCSSAGTWICSDFLGGEGTALLYGSSLDVFTSTEALLVLGVPGSRVQLVLPPPEPGPPCFPDPAVEAAVTASLKTSGVQVHRGWTMVRMERDGPDGPLTAVTFSRDPPEPEPPQDPEPFKVPEPPRDLETLHLQCGVFLNFSSKSVDPDAFSSISRSFLVFDGRLVINAGFQTCDPNIYAAGPLTQFSRRYHSPEWSHASFSSREVGRELALVLLRRLDPTLEPDRPPPGSDPLVPLYQKPKVQGGKLPGGFHYLHVTKPPPSCSKKTPAQTVQNPVVSTGRAETGNYFCLHLDPQDQLESLICLSLEPLPWSNYLVLVGKHQQLLGRLLDQYQQGQIQDLYRFFREPWVLPIFLDRFPDFQQELQQELQLISSDTLKDPGETEKTDVPPGGSAAAAAALRNRTLNYLSFNQNLLPMFPCRGQL